MELTPERARSLSFDTEMLGQTQSWVVDDRGIERTGEVIFAESVDPAWGLPLEGDVGFRVVLFAVPRRIPAGQIQDPRIAMAVPRRSLLRVQLTFDRELSAIHEARARYVTAREAEAFAVRSSMADREATVRSDLARRFAASFSLGRIYSHPSVRVRPGEIFQEDRTASWADLLALAVLSQAFPTLPVDTSGFPHALAAQDVAKLYGGLFQSEPGAQEATAAFGPGLGLTRGQNPSLFDAGECRAVAIVQSELEANGGEMPAEEMLRLLVGDHGLVRPLALLCLMAFVRQHRAELELRAGHQAGCREGGRFRGDRVTWDQVPELSFSESLAEQIHMLRVRPSVTWNTVLPYASLIVEGLRPAEETAAATRQERRLFEALKGTGSDVKNLREAMGNLEASLGDLRARVSEAVDRLEALAAVSSYREFFSVAQEHFGGPAGLGDALGVCARLAQLATLAPAIARTKRYLDAMTFGQSHQDLLLERDSVAGRFQLDGLADNPSLWSHIEDRFRHLRTGYATVYVSHHARYHREALEMDHLLDSLRPQVRALARFNEMPELGEPVGVDVSRRFRLVTESYEMCAAEVDGSSLEAAPY